MPNKRQLEAVRAMIPGSKGLGPYRSLEKAWDPETEKEVSVLVAWKVDGTGKPYKPKILMKLFKDPAPETLELMVSEPTGDIFYFGSDGEITNKMKGKIMEDKVRLRKGKK